VKGGRCIDLQRKCYLAASDLAEKLGLTANRSTAVRRELGIDVDADCRHEFKFGASLYVTVSDNAYRRMRHALDSDIDMDAVWKRHGWGQRRS
jgi:hypothetical protein